LGQVASGLLKSNRHRHQENYYVRECGAKGKTFDNFRVFGLPKAFPFAAQDSTAGPFGG
jgi:hypothetical protein